MSCSLIEKYTEELKAITLDLSNFAEIGTDGETVTDFYSASVDPEGLVLDVSTGGTITSTTASLMISGGAPGTTYKVLLLVHTSGGKIIGDTLTVDVLS